MVRETILCLVQLVFLHETHQPIARLPQYVFRADFCPYTNDSSQLQDASTRLHCLHDLDSTDTGNVYHCLPSSFLNETVEFCGKAITVPPGYCPIYNYTDKAGDVPGLYNCSAFISGCPSESFSSKDVRKFPSCLNIDRKHGCYKDDRNCPKTSATPVPKEITNSVETANNSTLPSIPTTSSPDITTADNHDKDIYVAIIVFGVCLIIGLIIISLRYRHLYLQMKERTTFPEGTDRHLYLQMKERTTFPEGTDEGTPFILENNTDQNIPNKTTKCDASCLTEVSDMVMTKNILPELIYFTEFLKRIEGRITDDTWHDMKIHLRKFVDHKCVEKMIPTKMLKQLSDMLKLQYNMRFLIWMFEKCGKPELVKDCQQYSSENQFHLECFKTNFTLSVESQPFEIQFMMLELESYREELQDLRNWLAKTIHVHPGQILMTALKNGPIVVTFLVRKKHGNAILEYLKTDDGQIAASKKRIEKIVQNGNVIEIGKSLNGSTFVNINLRLRGNISGIDADVRNLASSIFRRTGLTIEGNEIYIRTVPSDEKQNETKAKPIKEESFIVKNRGHILENIEPLTIVEQTDIASLFDRDDLAGMRDIGGRRDRAEYFLKLCDMLPKEKREIASPIKKTIQQKRKDLLDEIDSEFIEKTIYYLEDIPEKVKSSWFDPNKGRKEKATIFLDYVLQKDEYVKALKKTMDENGMQFTE